MKLQENVGLAPLTTIRVGGAARYYVEAKHENEIREALDLARAKSLPLFVLGGGSNVLVADTGWPGLVLKIAIGGIEQREDRNTIRFHVGAGVDWDDFVAHAIAQNCAGIECMSGIPGSVGGTPVQNVGAYGQEVSETIESVRTLKVETGETFVLPNAACEFRYRGSTFNSTERGQHIIVQVTYRLTRGRSSTLKYADLQKYFAGSESAPSLVQVREAVREIRRSKGMLIESGDPGCRSAGSFFKNPILSEETFKALSQRADTRGLKIPSYPALDAQRKISAAWLVENSGFHKGFTLGEAAISHKHALALINTGRARTADIVLLKDKIQQAVEEAWGVKLEPEPVFVGF